MSTDVRTPFSHENLKNFISCTYEDSEALINFIQLCCQKINVEELSEGMGHFYEFLETKKTKISSKAAKIYFVLFSWIGFHFLNIGDFKSSSLYYKIFDLNSHGIQLMEFNSYEEEVLEFFEHNNTM